MLILLAPIIYVSHIVEEAPRYIRWLNSVITDKVPDTGHFLADNVSSMAITAGIAILAAATLNRVTLAILLTWLSYFFLANGLFHIIATAVIGRYSPGTVTAIALYLPYFSWFVHSLRTRLPAWLIVTLILAGGTPMLMRAYWIVFRGHLF